MLRCGMIPRVVLSAESCYAESYAMSQRLAVAHRGGQLAHPTWAAHTTTTCREFFVDGSGRCEGSRQIDQGLSQGSEALHISYMSASKRQKHPDLEAKKLADRVLTNAQAIAA